MSKPPRQEAKDAMDLFELLLFEHDLHLLEPFVGLAKILKQRRVNSSQTHFWLVRYMLTQMQQKTASISGQKLGPKIVALEATSKGLQDLLNIDI